MFRASLKSNCLLIVNTSVPQSRRHITKIAASRRETLIGRQSSSSYTALKKGGGGVRYIRNTDKLVSESASIVVIDNNNNRNIYSSMSECAKAINISRKTIKKCLSSGNSYKGYTFILN